jgi:hypothetical protein
MVIFEEQNHKDREVLSLQMEKKYLTNKYFDIKSYQNKGVKNGKI